MIFAKDYHIEMLSVGAADTFILYVIDTQNNGHLILIDAGNYNDGDKIIQHIRKYYNNPIIDLAIVTHCDDDHYGGFVRMLKKLSNGDRDAIRIRQFWVNDPGKNHIDVNDVKYINNQPAVNNRAREIYNCRDLNLLELIDSLRIPRTEKFAESISNGYGLPPIIRPDSHFTFLYIIGPTKAYYEELIPKFRDNLKYNESDNMYNESTDIATNDSLSPTLDAADDDSSAHNQSSMIILFQPQENKRYLFMGDAGREAFDRIPLYHKLKITNVDWLKAPHHGSKHNLDSKMIKWIKPKVAYISANSNDEYANRCTIKALKRSRCDVYSTHLDHSDFIHKQIGEREGYSTATPL
ncbi:MAG: hypothetical protein IKA04_10280 [Alistipes sp.]|nr:hypothetical protein [Alistipes sp.]